MSRHSALPILAIAALLTFSGCASPEATFDPDSVAEVPADVEPEESPEADQGEADACAALAGVDIDALMGEAMDAPAPGSSTCRLQATAAMSASSFYVQANVDGAGSYANQKGLLTVTGELTAPGDEAFFGDTALAKGLDVLVEGHHLSVRIHRQSSPISGDELISVAEAVLTNLGW